jgi:hypothetical protein
MVISMTEVEIEVEVEVDVDVDADAEVEVEAVIEAAIVIEMVDRSFAVKLYSTICNFPERCFEKNHQMKF